MSKFKEIVEKAIEEVRLTENPNTRLKSALIGQNPRIESVAILTAENPEAQSLSRDQNKELMKRLKDTLNTGGHPYQQIRGNYDNDEHSIVIYNVSRRAAEGYAETYKQKAYIFGRKVKTGTSVGMHYEMWERIDENSPYKIVRKSDTITSDSELTHYFSRLHNYKFKINFPFDEALSERTLRMLDNLKESDVSWISDYIDQKIAGGMVTWAHNRTIYSKINKER